MPSLMDIPGLGGALQARQMNQQGALSELQQAQGLMGILGALQQQQQRQAALQEQQQIRGVLSRAAQETGGDPAKMAPLLMQTGHPELVKLGQSMIPKGNAIGSGGFLKPDGTIVAPAARPEQPKEAKPPAMRTRIQGEKQVQEEFQPDGTWKEVGQGPRFAKQVAGQGGGPGSTYASQGALDPVKDKDALRDLAIQSMYDPGSLAGFRRDTKTMGAIQRERINVMRETGVTSEDVVSGRAGFKADTASLNKITPQYDAITAFEKTAIRNGKILMELADKVDTTGVPVLERWIRAGRKEIGGDPDVSNMNAQMNLYRAEAARILTQPNLSGVLTDTARKEMEEVLKNSATAQQVRETVQLLERDFLNRKETLEEQIGSIRARMRSRATPSGADAIATPGAAPDTPAPATPKGAWKITPIKN